MTIRTFSGAHPFRPSCLIEAYEDCMRYEYTDPKDRREEAVEFVEERLPTIDAGRCARCNGDLEDWEIPSGSRLTACRCIPLCTTCGRAEALSGLAQVLIRGPEDGPLVPLICPVYDWPVSRKEQEDAVAEFDRRGQVREALLLINTDGGLSLATEEGVAQVQMREHPDGWLEHGYDESADRAERER